MNIRPLTGIGILLTLLTTNLRADVLKPSDVVFMYGADVALYREYGATVLAWGGLGRDGSAERTAGVRVFGSVGMVTEFARYYERFPERYAEGLCRDAQGQPVKVPWLTDHSHKGILFRWCCTQQPLFRQYLRERVLEVVHSGADGVHIDDHLGTAGGLWLGLCFCDRCVEGFRVYVAAMSLAARTSAGIAETDAGTFDYRTVVQRWLAEDSSRNRRASNHPLWPLWQTWHLKNAAAFMQELRAVATEAAGRAVPMGANAGLLWPRHLADYQAIDLFSAETDHHASGRKFTDAPLLAYRLADAVGRPYAATASGGDWAFIKEHGLTGLVQGWIAFSYAAGHRFMAPHRQWCYTAEKGTHWYQGPTEAFAPLYRFVRRHAAWLDGFRNRPDVTLVMPHRAYVASPERWLTLNRELAEAHLGYELLLGGDEIVDHPLPAEALARAHTLLVPELQALNPADQETLTRQRAGKRIYSSVSEVRAAVQPLVRPRELAPVRLFVRTGTPGTVVHLLNLDYHPGLDRVQPLPELKLLLNTEALALPRNARCRWIPFEGADQEVRLDAGAVTLRDVGLWGLLVIPKQAMPGTQRL